MGPSPLESEAVPILGAGRSYALGSLRSAGLRTAPNFCGWTCSDKNGLRLTAGPFWSPPIGLETIIPNTRKVPTLKERRLSDGVMTPYGWTCTECPSRGAREVVGDFVGVQYHHKETEAVECYDGVVRTLTTLAEPRWRTHTIGYPDRCKKCNKRYAAHKRAREAGLRLEMVRQAHESKEGARWKHLKFMTMTWPSKWTKNPEPDLAEFKRMFASTRAAVAAAIGAAGGTDVVEVITKTRNDGMFKHHIHTHGLWCAPFVPMDKLRAACEDAGVGRFEFTILRERKYDDGTDRVRPAIWAAVDYLAKYISKATDAKRMVWGDLRSWKEYLPKQVCRLCVKTTRQAKDYKQCDCESHTPTGRRS